MARPLVLARSGDGIMTPALGRCDDLRSIHTPLIALVRDHRFVGAGMGRRHYRTATPVVAVPAKGGSFMDTQTTTSPPEAEQQTEEQMCCDGSGRTVEQHRHESPDGKCCVDK
jgi:hypothetical protein